MLNFMPIISASSLQTQLARRITAFCGFSKGSGKTTALSWALQTARQAGPTALLTIGTHQAPAQSRSASSDSISNLPQLRVEPGDIVLTTLPLAKWSPASFEVLSLIPGRSSQGRLILGRAHRCGTVSLTGPEHFSSLRLAADLIWREKWAASVCLDGAANRMTQLSALPRLQVIYTITVNPENWKACFTRLKMLEELTGLSKTDAATDKAPADSSAVSISGPLTDSTAAALPDQIKTVIIDDFSKVFLNPEQWNRLCRSRAVKVRRSIRLLAVWLVLRDMRPDVIAEQLNALRIPILFNPFEINNPDIPV